MLSKNTLDLVYYRNCCQISLILRFYVNHVIKNILLHPVVALTEARK